MMDRVLFVIVDHDEDPQLKIHRLVDFVDCKVGSCKCLNVLLWYIMVCCVFCITTNQFVTITYILLNIYKVLTVKDIFLSS